MRKGNREFYMQCDNGFRATVREDFINDEDIRRLHKNEGLWEPKFSGGDETFAKKFIKRVKRVIPAPAKKRPFKDGDNWYCSYCSSDYETYHRAYSCCTRICDDCGNEYTPEQLEHNRTCDCPALN